MMDSAMLNNILMAIQIIVMAAGGFTFLWRLESKVSILNERHKDTNVRLDKVDKKLELFNGSLIHLAKQEERMNTIDTRMIERMRVVEDHFANVDSSIRELFAMAKQRVRK